MQQSASFQNEELVTTARKHFIVYISTALWHVFFGCVIFIFLVFLSEAHGAFWASVGEMISASFLLLLWTSFFYFWTNQYFDEWRVYETHMTAIDQKDILFRDESFLSFSKIQDVKFEKAGVLQNIFGYGTITIENAGTEQQFVIPYVADVEDVTNAILMQKQVLQVKEGI